MEYRVSGIREVELLGWWDLVEVASADGVGWCVLEGEDCGIWRRGAAAGAAVAADGGGGGFVVEMLLDETRLDFEAVDVGC